MRAVALSTAVLVLAAACTYPTANAAPPTRPGGPMVIAHRGGAGDFPENTILAINNAVAEGVDGLWLTVQASSDHVPVLFRPSDLSSLTNGTGLLTVALAHRCDPSPSPGTWAGFKLHRNLTITEQFTLGTGVTEVAAELWDPESVACFTSQPGSRVIAFGVNTEDDYRFADKIGVDAVLVDSPRSTRQWREG